MPIITIQSVRACFSGFRKVRDCDHAFSCHFWCASPFLCTVVPDATEIPTWTWACLEPIVAMSLHRSFPLHAWNGRVSSLILSFSWGTVPFSCLWLKMISSVLSSLWRIGIPRIVFVPRVSKDLEWLPRRRRSWNRPRSCAPSVFLPGIFDAVIDLFSCMATSFPICPWKMFVNPLPTVRPSCQTYVWRTGHRSGDGQVFHRFSLISVQDPFHCFLGPCRNWRQHLTNICLPLSGLIDFWTGIKFQPFRPFPFYNSSPSSDRVPAKLNEEAVTLCSHRFPEAWVPQFCNGGMSVERIERREGRICAWLRLVSWILLNALQFFCVEWYINWESAASFLACSAFAKSSSFPRFSTRGSCSNCWAIRTFWSAKVQRRVSRSAFQLLKLTPKTCVGHFCLEKCVGFCTNWAASTDYPMHFCSGRTFVVHFLGGLEVPRAVSFLHTTPILQHASFFILLINVLILFSFRLLSLLSFS